MRATGAGLRTGSLRVRTVVAILALLVVLLGALAITVEATLGGRLRAQIEDRLHDRASAAAALVGTVDSADLADRLSAQGLSVLIRDADGQATVAGPSPEQLRKGPKGLGPVDGPGATKPSASSGSAGTGASASGSTPATPGAKAASVTITSSRIVADDQIITLDSVLSDGSTIVLTADASSVGQTLTQLRWVMLAASGGFLLVAAVGLVLVVRAALRPLDRMTRVARSIAGGDRGRRLRPTRDRTEIGRVALAFDEMLDAVEGAERKALEAEARVRAFVSDAAHELRTPVAGMRAAADTLVRVPSGPAERERLASHVAREAGRASRLIDDMLMMARVDRGLELDLTSVDLGRLVTAEAERHRLRHPSLDLVITLPEGPVVVDADQDRLAQVVGNLVDNASRATGGRGAVELRVTTSSASDGGRLARLTVTDDGPGVPVEERERIFDRLVRLDAGREWSGGGAGLGLPIARGIARAHGGDLVCEVVPSGTAGAAFLLTLPARVTPRGPDAPRPVPRVGRADRAEVVRA